ncbi:MAG: hypothetical protein MUE63_00385 [Xanthomonadales bacterium]|jgi:hypothetical protein|nr:hypothetical protein [Xanthomonadales bacterium]
MRKVLYVILAIAAVAAWRDWGQRAITHPPGVLVPEYPRQETAEQPRTLDIDGYRLTPRARFEIRARVLSREDYFWGNEADLSPIDLALGWGAMSDQAVLDRIEISQGSRWYFTRYAGPAPLPDRDIIRHSGNMHIVPADPQVLRQLKKIRRGDIVRATGYLVDIDHPSGFRWRTSLSREDTGGGSCEIFYLQRIGIEGRG